MKIQTIIKRGIIALILILLVLGTILFRAYIMPIQLAYCQGVAMKYLPYYFDSIKLNRIEQDDLGTYGREYRNIELIRINFSIPHEKYYYEVNNAIYELWSETKGYLNEHKDNELNKKNIRLSISDHGQITCLCNYINEDTQLLNNQWTYCEGCFKNWKEVNLFSEVYGLENCYITDIADIENIDPEKWKNINYMHIRTGSGDEVKGQIKEKLSIIFPCVDIIIE